MKLINSQVAIKALLLGLVLTLVGCKSATYKSLSELKDEQKTAIRRLIADKGLSVVELSSHSLPSTIDPSVYYLMPNGLYMRVIDAGSSTDRAVKNETIVYAEFEGFQFNHTTSPILTFNNHSRSSVPPVEFRYTHYYNAGDIHFMLINQTAPQVNYDALMCEGLAYPMTLLGDGARVSLIIPFEIGPSGTYSSGYTMFVKEAEYKFRK